MTLGPKEKELLDYLHEHVFDPNLQSPTASSDLKSGIRLTIKPRAGREEVWFKVNEAPVSCFACNGIN